VTHTDGVADVSKGALEQLIDEDAVGVCETEERMVCEHNLQSGAKVQFVWFSLDGACL
jgi:hypothetical protein